VLRFSKQNPEDQVVTPVAAAHARDPQHRTTSVTSPPTVLTSDVVTEARRVLVRERRKRTVNRLTVALPLFAVPITYLVAHLTGDTGTESALAPFCFALPWVTMFISSAFGPSPREQEAAVRLAEHPEPDALRALLDVWAPTASRTAPGEAELERAMVRLVPEHLRHYAQNAARTDTGGSAAGPLDRATVRSLATRLEFLYPRHVAGYCAPRYLLSDERADLLVSLVRLLGQSTMEVPMARRALRRIAGSRAVSENQRLVRDVAAACLAAAPTSLP